MTALGDYAHHFAIGYHKKGRNVTKNYLLPILLTAFPHNAHGMQRATKPPQTLLACFEMPNAQGIPTDVELLLVKAVIGPGGWWYKTATIEHKDTVHKVRFTPGTTISTVTDNEGAVFSDPCKDLAYVWDCSGKQINQAISVRAIDFNSSIPTMALAADDDNLQAWDDKGNAYTMPLDGENKEIKDIALHPTEQIISTISKDNNACLWDFAEKKVFISLNACTITCNPQRTLIGTIGLYGKRGSLRNSSGDKLHALKHTAFVIDLTFNPKKNILATASGDATACVWDYDGKKLATLQHAKAVHRATFNLQGTRLATASDKTACLWNCDGTKLRTFWHNFLVSDVVFHKEKQMLATASAKCVYIWQEHERPKLKEVLLRQIIKTWLLTLMKHRENSGFGCASEEGIPTWMATKFNLQEEELKAIWEAMPEKLRVAIFNTITDRIQNL